MVKRQSKAVKLPGTAGVRFIFLGYQFKSNFYDRSEILDVVQEAVQIAEDDLRKSYPRIKLELKHAASIGEPINRQIISSVKSASVAIFEVSDKNANVYFEMGLSCISSGMKPLLLINKRESSTIVASDVRDVMRRPYRKLRDAMGAIANHIKNQISSQIFHEIRSDEWRNLRKIWSGRITSPKVTVVCPELPKSYQPSFAQPESVEFVNLAHFGDLDSLVEVLTLLPKLFLDVEVKYVTSDEVHRNDRRGDMIIIGGPDFNRLTAALMKTTSLPYQYQTRANRTSFIDMKSREVFTLEKYAQGRVKKDYGLFVRIPNPWDYRYTVIMIGGLQTFGVLGAVEAFKMNAVGKKNTKKIIRYTSKDCHFAVLIPVRVIRSQPCDSVVDEKLLKICRDNKWSNVK